jgi:hypothetical protein
MYNGFPLGIQLAYVHLDIQQHEAQGEREVSGRREWAKSSIPTLGQHSDSCSQCRSVAGTDVAPGAGSDLAYRGGPHTPIQPCPGWWLPPARPSAGHRSCRHSPSPPRADGAPGNYRRDSTLSGSVSLSVVSGMGLLSGDWWVVPTILPGVGKPIYFSLY